MSAPLEGTIIEPGTLVQQIPQPSVEPLFATEGALKPLLEAVAAKARDFTPNLKTKAGREAIASQAYKVAQTKTYLEGLGKDLAAELKERPKKVDAARKAMRDYLDALRDEVRKPLTDWEQYQAEIKLKLDTMANMPQAMANDSSEAILGAINHLENLEPTDAATWGEFCGDAADTKAATLAKLRDLLAVAQKREEDARELERLREAERIRKEEAEKERLRLEGEARARREAEDRIAREQEEARRREQEARERAERAEREAEEAQRRLEDERKQAAEREAQAIREAEERLRQQMATPAPAPAPAPQPTTTGRWNEHQKAINREVMASLLPVVGGDADLARQITLAILDGKIPHLHITY